VLLIYCTVRTFEEQARLYRQSRTLAEIQRKRDQFKADGFPMLADILMSVGPQQGKLGAHVTCAACGESWHNYARALDAVPLVNGKPAWKTSSPLWQLYGEAAEKIGLEWAGRWKRFKEYPHVQLPIAPGANPLTVLTPAQVATAVTRWRSAVA
jgi:peptidoglycan L-alanyl-D-glutamate endopeptidase CwlK